MKRRDFILLLLAALALRAVYYWQLSRYDLLDVLILDPRAYDAEARRILAGGSFPHAFYQAPLYSYLLAVFYAFAGRELWVVRIAQAVMGAASILLTADLGARIFGRAAGILAGVLSLLYGVLVFYEGQVMKTSLTIFLAVVLLWLLEPVRRGALPPLRALGAGALLGLAILTRENLLLYLPVVALLLWLPARQPLAAVLFGAAALATVLPVTLHNRRAEGEWILVTSQGGQNFYIGNHEGATGTYANPVFVRPDPIYERFDFHAEAERRVGERLTAGETSSFWYAQAMKEMISDPARTIRLFAKKLLIVFEGVERPDNESLYVMRDEAPLLKLVPLTVALIAPLGLLGMIAARSRRGELAYLHLFVITNVVSLVLFFVVSRYRVVIVPVLIIFAAAALLQLARWVRERRAGALVGSALLLAVTVSVLSVPTWAGPDPRDYLSTVHYLNRARIYAGAGRFDEAAAHYEEAIRQNDRLAFLHFEYANVLRELGRSAKAREELEAAIGLIPTLAPAHNNLGILLAQGGELGRAEQEFREARRLSPQWADPLQNLVHLYETVGDAARLAEAQAALARLGQGGGP